MPGDLLERMRANPAGDWRIHDVEALCREHARFRRQGYVACSCASSLGARDLTIPAHRPIKPVYIRKLVRYIDSYGGR